MGRKQREIDALKLQLEEVLRANEDLRLENAEFRAKFDMLQNSVKADSAPLEEQIENIEDADDVAVAVAEDIDVESLINEEDIENEPDLEIVSDEKSEAILKAHEMKESAAEPKKEKIEVVDFTPEKNFFVENDTPNYFYNPTQREGIDTTPYVKDDDDDDTSSEFFTVETGDAPVNQNQDEEIEKEVVKEVVIDHSDEIAELKKQNEVLFDELKAIRELLIKKEEEEVKTAEKKSEIPTAPTNVIPNTNMMSGIDPALMQGYPDITNNMGKLIVDSQIGAAKIIDEAKKEAQKQLEDARKEADRLKAKMDENNYAVYRKLGSARRDIDDIISQMETVSDHINFAKNMVSPDEDDLPF